MPEIQAERRIVKSAPELWAELSELESLARHLGEFGEIRITRLEPETTVAWEGDGVSGTVELEASGWGTKVRLTVATPHEQPPASAACEPAPGDSGDLPEETPAADPGDLREEPLDEIEIAAVSEALTVEPPAPAPPREPVPDPATVAAQALGHSIPPPTAPEPAPAPRPRQGWLGRLLRRRSRAYGGFEPASLDAALDASDVDTGPGAGVEGLSEPRPERFAEGGPDDVVIEAGEGFANGLSEGDEGFANGLIERDKDGRGDGIEDGADGLSEGDGDARDRAWVGDGIDEGDRSPTTAETFAGAAAAAASERAERMESVLATVLDDLGAAHHRPFSRG